MILKTLTIQDFRCYGHVPPFPLHQLTVFIGENDAGKTVVLDALEILLTNKVPASGDYRDIGQGQPADTIVIRGTFALEPAEALPERWTTPGSRDFTIIKTFSKSGLSKCEVLGLGYVDPRYENFAAQNAETQKTLLVALGLLPESNGHKRLEQFLQAAAANKVALHEVLLPVPFAQVETHLPRFQRISSSDYRQPESLVQNVLQGVVDAFVRPRDPATNEPVLRPELAEISRSIQAALDAKIGEMQTAIQNANPNLRGVRIQPNIDFARAVTARNFVLDIGQGLKPLDSFGDGTKKKLWMGLLDWIGATNLALAGLSIIRVYDEPDINLDYAAEHRLFSGILDVVSTPGSRTQAIVCTHAITMVDRAPAHSINLIKVLPDGSRQLLYLIGTDDEAVALFLSIMERTVGIANSALFYERAFLVVEGESEENALPIFYRNLYGRSMIEDGIVLLDLRTCGAWRSILKILQRNKAEVTVMLLDQDCTDPDSSAYITPATLVDIGYPADFQAEGCQYIGTKEFEDAFANSDIIAVLNNFYRKQDETEWVEADIDQFRLPGTKFSEALLHHVRRNCEPALRQSARKPEFAERLAQHCSTPGQVPLAIRSVLARARVLAGHAG